jgi:hypothetical protein
MTIASVKERGDPIMFGLNSSIPPVDAWPLRFKRHNFGAYCFNTLKCSVIYDCFQFVSEKALAGPSGELVSADRKESWTAGYIVGDAFAAPIQVDWVSLDGAEHRASVDLVDIFGDRLVRHVVPKADIPEGWLAAKGLNPLAVEILMEVNDRVINIYMLAHVTTKEPQIPGNPRSCHRYDLIKAWTRTY